ARRKVRSFFRPTREPPCPSITKLNTTIVPGSPNIRKFSHAGNARGRLTARLHKTPHLVFGYGPSSRRIIDLFPSKDDDKAPLAMFIHGGYWRSLEPSMFSHIAAGLNGRGVTVAVAGYDLCPHVSIADIIEQMRSACLMLWRKRHQRIC